VLFRADHAMARPGNRFQALLLKFLFALDAAAVGIRLNAFQRFVDQRQHGPVGIGLTEQEFLGVGICSLVRKIHRRIVIRGPALFLGPRNCLDQLLAPGLQLFFVIIQTLLIHSRAPPFTQIPLLQTGDCRPAILNCQGRARGVQDRDSRNPGTVEHGEAQACSGSSLSRNFKRPNLQDDHFRYCSSLTFSIQSTALPSFRSWMAKCVMAVDGVAPCQCFSPGGNHTTSPGLISSTAPPSR
jgi:hypothetical protein